MADRKLYQDGASFHPGKVDLFAEFVAGTSGAVPAISTGWVRRAGVLSCVLSGTGLYTFTLQDTYLSLLDYSVNIMQATYAAAHGGKGVIAPLSGNVNAIPIQVLSTDGSGTAVVLTAGDTIKVHLTLSRIAGNG